MDVTLPFDRSQAPLHELVRFVLQLSEKTSLILRNISYDIEYRYKLLSSRSLISYVDRRQNRSNKSGGVTSDIALIYLCSMCILKRNWKAITFSC